MPDMNAKLLKVTEDRSPKKGMKLWRVALDDGKEYTTFEPEIADAAIELRGKHVIADVSESQNGNFTNYKLWGVVLDTTVDQMLTGNSNDIPTVVDGRQALSPVPDASVEREQRIVRQSSLRTAFDFFAATAMSDTDTEEIIDRSLRLAARIDNQAYNGFVEEPSKEKIPW
jgi:hypothetical protein